MVLWERNKMKQKNINFNLDINDYFDFDLNEVIIGTTDDEFDIEINSTSKFLFYRFNNLHALEKLQNRDWLYFINRLLDISDGDISSLNLFNFDQNWKDAE